MRTRSPMLIGITGPSGSGKSTIAKKLKASSRLFERVRLDDYFRQVRTFPKKHGFRNWEVPGNIKFRVLERHLRMLQKGLCVRMKTFPKRKGMKRKHIVLRPRRYIVVEGFLLLADRRIRAMLNTSVYLDIPAQKMLERREKRFGRSHVGAYDRLVAVPEFLKRGARQKRYAKHVVNAQRPLAEVERNVRCIIASLS